MVFQNSFKHLIEAYLKFNEFAFNDYSMCNGYIREMLNGKLSIIFAEIVIENQKGEDEEVDLQIDYDFINEELIFKPYNDKEHREPLLIVGMIEILQWMVENEDREANMLINIYRKAFLEIFRKEIKDKRDREYPF